ncbi:hypothetical protein ACOCJ7_02645 [Knoellia sp. CPCC 206453]|uniref:hypothetical protein n=1 Tax=Knoellia pratensis TaxID=3404796 RepID=UPI00361676DE
MTRPKGRSTSSTPGESELGGRQEPRRPRPASASDALASRGRAGSDTVGEEEPEFGEVATDALLDAKEKAKSRRRKKPGPTREGGPSDGTGAGGIPDLLTEPTESTEPTEPTRAPDQPGG